MASRIAQRVEEWSTVAAGTGYDGLRTLAADEFTGVVRSGDTEAAMVNGRIVGIFEGSVETFAGESLTAHEAPHMALPLLYAMQRQDPTPRAQYYTADTPLTEVDQTLAGGFTGFVELSENVLSGDYYVVYYGGQSLSVAFIGESDRLVTGEEAFEMAVDEVGIYEVFDAAVTVHDLPPAEDDPDGVDAEPTDTAATEATADETATTPSDATPDAGSDEAPVDKAAETTSEDTGEETVTVETTPPTPADSAPQAPAQADSPEPADADRQTADEPAIDDDSSTTTALDDTAVTQIPALDPGRTKPATDSEDTGDRTGQPSALVQANGQASPQPESPTQVQQLREKVSSLTAERDELAQAHEAAQQTVEDLEAENERLQERITELTREKDRLEEQIAELEADTEPQPAGRRLSRAEAMAQTALFLRYESKGAATLDEIDSAEQTAINDNLVIDYHTQFDTGSVTVDGEPFEAFIEATIEYRFLRWLVREFVYEIRDTGSQAALKDLYEAIPQIDRVQFHERIDLEADADQDGVAFDCVAFDRVGNPLFVAEFNDTRDPATEDVVAELSRNATAAAGVTQSLGAAFYVTASFFEPGALETATSSTGGGLLSRDARKSHVKISRTQGYHLCLVEARDQGLNLALPEM